MKSNNKTTEEGFINVHLAGRAEDSSKKFKIQYRPASGDKQAVWMGCTITTEKKIGSKTIRNFMPVVAFGEIADELSVVEKGDWLEVKGEFGRRKGNDDNWYNQVIITEVVDMHE